MTEKELRKLSRADLLEMLIDQSTELQSLRTQLAEVQGVLQQKELSINSAGSIAEASLQLSGIFGAAEDACRQYTDNIRLLNERQDAACEQREQESIEAAQRMIAETKQRCAALEAETQRRCDELLQKAKLDSQVYWNEVSERLNSYFDTHREIRKLLSISLPMFGQD